MKVAPYADVYVARIAKDIGHLPNASENVAKVRVNSAIDSCCIDPVISGYSLGGTGMAGRCHIHVIRIPERSTRRSGACR